MAHTLLDLAAKMMTMEADVRAAMEQGVVRGSRMMAKVSKNIIGHEQSSWAPLAPATIAQKAKGNTPLLETGEYKASITWEAPFWEGVNVCAGWIGTNDPKAVWQEFGTARIPPRPVFGLVAMGRGEQAAQIVGASVASAMIHGGHNYHDLREFLHALRELGRELKELVDDDDDSEKRG